MLGARPSAAVGLVIGMETVAYSIEGEADVEAI